MDNFSNSTDFNNSKAAPDDSPVLLLAIRVGVGTFSFLSVVGASLIIFTFLAFRDLRTLSRQLLVNLSVADLIVGVSHLVGLLGHADNFGDNTNRTDSSWFCTTQAAFSVFGVESSILWTIAMAIYLYVIIVLSRPILGRFLVPVFYVVCWGIPAVLTSWLGASHLLGFEPGGDPAFCGILGTVVVNSTTGKTKHVIYPIIVGYEMWNYLAFIVLPTMYIAIRCHVKIKVNRAEGIVPQGLQSLAKSADLKLISIPVIYLLLRVWSAIVDIAIYYEHPHLRREYRSSVISAILLLVLGVCASSQGFANCILFCVFTKAVRQRLLSLKKYLYCKPCCERRTYMFGIESNSVHDDREWLVGSNRSTSTDYELTNSETYGTTTYSSPTFVGGSTGTINPTQ